MATFNADTPLEGLDLLTVSSALEHFDLRQYMATFTTTSRYGIRMNNRLCLRCMCLSMSRNGDGRVRAMESMKNGGLIVHRIEPRGDEECARCSILPAPLDRRQW